MRPSQGGCDSALRQPCCNTAGDFLALQLSQVPVIPSRNVRLDASMAPEEVLDRVSRLPYPFTDQAERFTVPPPLPNRLLLLHRELHTHLHHSSCPSSGALTG